MSELTALHDALVSSFYFPEERANCTGAAKANHPPPRAKPS